MTRPDLVIPEGHRQHGVRAVDAAAQVLEQIERGLVCPVQVFKYDQGRSPLERVERGREDQIAVCAGGNGRQQLALRLERDVMERCERPGIEQLVTGYP